VYCDTPDDVARNRGTWCKQNACSPQQALDHCDAILRDVGCSRHEPFYFDPLWARGSGGALTAAAVGCYAQTVSMMAARIGPGRGAAGLEHTFEPLGPEPRENETMIEAAALQPHVGVALAAGSRMIDWYSLSDDAATFPENFRTNLFATSMHCRYRWDARQLVEKPQATRYGQRAYGVE
jgi:hypothetical protein